MTIDQKHLSNDCWVIHSEYFINPFTNNKISAKLERNKALSPDFGGKYTIEKIFQKIKSFQSVVKNQISRSYRT